VTSPPLPARRPNLFDATCVTIPPAWRNPREIECANHGCPARTATLIGLITWHPATSLFKRTVQTKLPIAVPHLHVEPESPASSCFYGNCSWVSPSILRAERMLLRTELCFLLYLDF